MVDPKHPDLSIQSQCELLGVNRSSYYYQAKETSEEEFTLLRLLDEQYLKTPFYGSRKMIKYLRSLGYCINRKRVIKLMSEVVILSKANRKVPYPYDKELYKARNFTKES